MFNESFNDQWAERGEDLMITVGILIGGWLLFLLLRLLFNRFLKRAGLPHHEIIRKIQIPALIAFEMAVLFFVLPFFDITIPKETHISHLISLITIAIIAWVLIQGVAVVRLIVEHNYDITVTDNLQARKIYTQFRLIQRVIVFLIVIIATAVALMTYEQIRQIGVSLLASAGLAGIIIGFAAQRMLTAVLAGIQLAFTQPIRLEDVVIVEGEWGWIEEISLTYVVVRSWDKRRLVVPTTYFIENPFQNWTRQSADILGTVYIYADYTLPVKPLREELERIVNDHPAWDQVACNIQVTNATEKSMELRALVSAATAPKAWELRVHVREQLIRFLQEKYPQCLPQTRVQLEKESHSTEK